jgi:hypothetical protein
MVGEELIFVHRYSVPHWDPVASFVLSVEVGPVVGVQGHGRERVVLDLLERRPHLKTKKFDDVLMKTNASAIFHPSPIATTRKSCFTMESEDCCYGQKRRKRKRHFRASRAFNG